MDKYAKAKRLEWVRNQWESEKDPMRRRKLREEGLKLKRELGLSDKVEIERIQLGALKAAERERLKGAK